jgi:hypothetical protein
MDGAETRTLNFHEHTVVGFLIALRVREGECASYASREVGLGFTLNHIVSASYIYMCTLSSQSAGVQGAFLTVQVYNEILELRRKIE